MARESGIVPQGTRVVTVDGEEPSDGSSPFLEFREENEPFSESHLNGHPLPGNGYYENAGYDLNELGTIAQANGTGEGNSCSSQQKAIRFAITGKAWAIANKHKPQYIEKVRVLLLVCLQNRTHAYPVIRAIIMCIGSSC